MVTEKKRQSTKKTIRILKDKYIYLVVGISGGIIFTLIYFSIEFGTSDKVLIFNTVINAGVLLFVSTFLAKHQHNSKSLKEHFVGQIKEYKNEYVLFVSNIFSGELSKKQINSSFKKFSEDFNNSQLFIKKVFEYETFIQVKNRKIHFLLCNNDKFDMLKPDENLVITPEKRSKVAKELKEFKHLLENLMVEIHSY